MSSKSPRCEVDIPLKIEQSKENIIHYTILARDNYGRCEMNAYPNTGECLLHSLFVYKKHRLRGVATKLMKVAEALALKESYKTIHLYVKIASWRYAWYQRMGYKDSGTLCQRGYADMVKHLIKNLK